MAKKYPHRGPYQEFTEVCMACGRNSYTSDSCTPPKTVTETVKKIFKIR